MYQYRHIYKIYPIKTHTDANITIKITERIESGEKLEVSDDKVVTHLLINFKYIVIVL